MNRPCVYVLKSKEGVYYYGSTSNLEERIKKHKKGGSTFTSKYTEWELIGAKYFKTVKEARLFEKKIKKSQHARELFKNQLTGSSSIG